MSESVQITLTTPKIHVEVLTPTQIKHLFLKVKISPSPSVDCKMKKEVQA